MKRLSFLLSILALAAVPARAEDPVTVAVLPGPQRLPDPDPISLD